MIDASYEYVPQIDPAQVPVSRVLAIVITRLPTWPAATSAVLAKFHPILRHCVAICGEWVFSIHDQEA